MFAKKIDTLYKIINIAALLFLSIIFVASLKVNILDKQNIDVSHFLYLFLSISGILVFINIIKNIPLKFLVPGLLILSFILRLWWINAIDTQPNSDFLMLLNAAKELSIGETDIIKHHPSNYFYKYPYNLSFVLYETAVYKLFHAVYAFKLINVLLSTFIVWLIFLISKQVFNEKTALIAMTFSAIFPPFIYINSILTNQILAFALILSAIYLFLKKKKFLYIGLLLAFANLIRPVAIVFLAGIFIYYSLNIFKKQIGFNKKFFMDYLKSITLLIGTYYLTIFIVFTAINLTKIPVVSMFHDPIPNYKFLVGLNPASNGRYNNEDSSLASNFENYKIESTQKIKERLTNKTQLLKLFKTKIKDFWGHKNSELFWSFSGVPPQYQYYKFAYYEWMLYLSFVFFSILFLVKAIFYSQKKTNIIVFFNLLLLMFGFIYLFIEIQARYRYSIYFIFIILSAGGAGMLFKQGINTKIKNH